RDGRKDALAHREVAVFGRFVRHSALTFTIVKLSQKVGKSLGDALRHHVVVHGTQLLPDAVLNWAAQSPRLCRWIGELHLCPGFHRLSLIHVLNPLAERPSQGSAPTRTPCAASGSQIGTHPSVSR